MLYVRESVKLTFYLYAQTMGQQRMLYIRKFYVVKNIYISIYNHRWDTGTQLQWCVNNMARNDLRARGGAWGARGATPTARTGYNFESQDFFNNGRIRFNTLLSKIYP